MKSHRQRPFFVMFTSFAFVTGAFVLFGCDNGRNSDTICKNNPELCEDLHKDSWCRYEKGDLIRQRFILKTTPNPTGKQIYDQLRFLEVYSKCIELASGVQHKVNVQRTNDRLRAFGISVQNLEELQESTKGSQDPYLAYYHWSRLDDAKSLAVLIKAEKEGQISDPELLSKLAIYYLKTDAARAKKLYLDVLGMVDADHLDPDWLLGLATASRTLGDLDGSYLYSRANIALTKQSVNEAQMLALLTGDKTKAAMLDSEAEQLAKAVSSGNFAGSAIEKRLRAEIDTERAKIEPVAPLAQD